jgi:4-amino-4-deoxy-L-arabinose transferase-like glycosyltransferase
MSALSESFEKVKSFYLKYKKVFVISSVLMVFIIALALRMAFMFKMEHPELKNDAYNYDVMAKNFLDNGYWGYTDSYSHKRAALKPNAVITPGYPMFLAAIYSVTGYKDGSPLQTVRTIQAIIGALTCLIVYLLGKKVGNRKVGLIASFFYAIYPSFVWATTLILTETLYNFLFLLYLYIQIRLLDNLKSIKAAVVCGLVFAAAIFVRPVAIPLIVVPFVYQYIKSGDRQVIKTFAFTLAGLAAVLIPWWIRNVVVLDKFILLATQTGNPLIAGSFPYFKNIDLSRYNVEDPFKAGIGYIIDGFITQPVLYLKWFTIGKFTYLFKSPWFYPPEGFTFLSSLAVMHGFIVSFGWIGVIVSLIRRRYVLITSYIILLTGLQLLFVPEARYAHSIMPLLMILTACLLEQMLFKRKKEASQINTFNN